MRKICVVTDSRAEYGHLYWLMKEIEKDPDLKLQMIVCGAHLSAKYNSTYKTIERDGFKIDRRLKTLLYADSEVGVAKSTGLGCMLFAEAFGEIKPDIVVMLGDRYEMLSAAIAAYIAMIPIAHIHGGETTQGLIDEGIRHSITKMASIHFAGTEKYRRRIIQMGENPNLVFNYGAPGLDHLYKTKLLNREQLAKELDFELNGEVAIVTYHPVTLEKNTSKEQIENVLKAIDGFGFKAVFTTANADTHGRIINKEIHKYCNKNPKKYKFFSNLGQIRYLSCLANFDLVIGNSSSGLCEAPSFKIPVVNIGDRQKGRIKAGDIIDAGYSVSSIRKGIKKALSDKFTESIKNIENPYARYRDGRVSYRIKEKLKKLKISDYLIKKEFNDFGGH